MSKLRLTFAAPFLVVLAFAGSAQARPTLVSSNRASHDDNARHGDERADGDASFDNDGPGRKIGDGDVAGGAPARAL